MPKLLANTFEKKKLRIERAALRLFTRKGSHGSTVREIAKKAGVSMGKLYLYFDTKEDIFIDLLQRSTKKMEDLRQKELIPVLMPLDLASMKKLALMIGRIVDMLAGHQQEIHAERDWKLEAAREQRKNRRQRAA